MKINKSIFITILLTLSGCSGTTSNSTTDYNQSSKCIPVPDLFLVIKQYDSLSHLSDLISSNDAYSYAGGYLILPTNLDSYYDVTAYSFGQSSGTMRKIQDNAFYLNDIYYHFEIPNLSVDIRFKEVETTTIPELKTIPTRLGNTYAPLKDPDSNAHFIQLPYLRSLYYNNIEIGKIIFNGTESDNEELTSKVISNITNDLSILHLDTLDARQCRD